MKITKHVLPILLVAILTSSCKKGQKEPFAEKTVNMDKSTVLPGDMVTISTSFSLPSASSALIIGGKQVMLVATEDKKAVFTVPVLVAGNYSVNFSAIGVNTSPNITISAYEPITNPQAVFDQFKNKTEVAMTEMAEFKNDPVAPLSAEDYAFMIDLNSQLEAIYPTLNTEEKLLAAYSLQKLSFEKADLASLDNNRDLYAISSTGIGIQPQVRSAGSSGKIAIASIANAAADAGTDADPGESLVRTGKKFVTSMSFTVSAIGIGVLALEAPEPTGLTKFIAVAAGITAGYQLSQALTLVGRICSQFGVPSTINDPVFKPASTMSLYSKSALSSTPNPPPAGLKLYNNAPLNLEVTSKFRTLTTADAGSSNDLIKSIFQGEQQLASMYNKLQSAFNKVKSWFSGKSPALPGYTSKWKTTSAEKDFYLPANTLSLSNVSDATVNLATTIKESKLVVTASSGIGTAEKPLSFDLTYKNATLGTSVKKTINATYDPRVSILGKWLIKNHHYTLIWSNGIKTHDYTFKKFIPEGSWTFTNHGIVSLFNLSDSNAWIKLAEADASTGGWYPNEILKWMSGEPRAFTLSEDKKSLKISGANSTMFFEVLTLSSTTLEIKTKHPYGTEEESSTLTFIRQ